MQPQKYRHKHTTTLIKSALLNVLWKVMRSGMWPSRQFGCCLTDDATQIVKF